MSTVGAEIDYVRACLALEQERFGDRLRVEWAVDDRLTRVALPPLVLQPLVENALAHGLGAMADGGTIRIDVAGNDEAMTLSVADDGPGFPASVVQRTGLGNLRERLATLYGQRASLRLESTSSGGARVAVVIPRR
jgi:two-component system, LytTR family, sensor kinase